MEAGGDENHALKHTPSKAYLVCHLSSTSEHMVDIAITLYLATFLYFILLLFPLRWSTVLYGARNQKTTSNSLVTIHE